ncbi:MAG: beta-lactamase family protein [Bacteroidales bacterium]|jgi:CubicO group peptidase (beta-lactamase class C family)|nr:beta-lactamase family protein [Bacteroidales bacterium]
MKYLFILLFIAIAFSSCGRISASDGKPPIIEELSNDQIDSIFYQVNTEFKLHALDSLVEDIFRNLNGTLLIARKDTLILRQSSGYCKLYGNRKGYETWSKSDMEKAREMLDNFLNDDTFYELASISKQFTAAAVLKLVDGKKLNLTDSLYEFYPELPYKNVTIHQLLSHTSGLPEYFDFPISWFDTSHLLTNQELISILAVQKPAAEFNPGYNFKYTNTNYALLAAIVEKVADLQFEDYVRKNIFLPAGMTETFYITELDDQEGIRIACGHLGDKSETPRYYLDGTVGDKGVYSTPEELLKWKISYFNKKTIISEELLKKATSKQNYIKGRGVASEQYGYGLRLEDNKELGKLIYHGGLWRGYQHVMVYRPEDETVVIFLSNFRNRAHLGKSNQILQLLDGA